MCKDALFTHRKWHFFCFCLSVFLCALSNWQRFLTQIVPLMFCLNHKEDGRRRKILERPKLTRPSPESWEYKHSDSLSGSCSWSDLSLHFLLWVISPKKSKKSIKSNKDIPTLTAFWKRSALRAQGYIMENARMPKEKIKWLRIFGQDFVGFSSSCI